ncbi:MAG TPA: peptidase M23 [Rhodobacteraceae bacterium]|jgi:murein DD-endopeptidase MepM/ murein hydrolase activator NlpD|nr:peptidase M23 [Paracoccaceae bacterium]HBV55487.1 peptidase M23 [Paracoccaceae bacterium]
MTYRPGHPGPRATLVLGFTALALLAGCSEPFDMDLRGNFGNALSTSQAARNATAERPQADQRGVISYPGYQVAVARRGDTVESVGARIGVDAGELARFNGLQSGDSLRDGEVIALPKRIAEISPAPAAQSGNVDITTLAGNAIDRSNPAVQTSALPPANAAPAAPAVMEPVRHKVQRGETAYTVARLYNVPVKSLAEWNGLGTDFAIREGQYLMIPVANQAAPAVVKTTVPGQGSPTPVPPSATKPLPQESTVPAAQAAAPATAPDLGKTQTTKSTSKMTMPLNGKIIRDYKKGTNEGIDIQAASGSSIVAAQSGTVAAITADADQVPIVVLKHDGNLLTVYANVEGITVKKGDSVSRGQSIAKVRSGASNYLHFEVRKGFDSVDPNPYLK